MCALAEAARDRFGDQGAFVAGLRDKGLLVVGAAENVIRLVPPLIIDESHVAEAVAARGFRLVSGGTDNHLFVMDFLGTELSGLKAQRRLDRAGITTSKSTVPKPV